MFAFPLPNNGIYFLPAMTKSGQRERCYVRISSLTHPNGKVTLSVQAGECSKVPGSSTVFSISSQEITVAMASLGSAEA